MKNQFSVAIEDVHDDSDNKKLIARQLNFLAKYKGKFSIEAWEYNVQGRDRLYKKITFAVKTLPFSGYLELSKKTHRLEIKYTEYEH